MIVELAKNRSAREIVAASGAVYKNQGHPAAGGKVNRLRAEAVAPDEHGLCGRLRRDGSGKGQRQSGERSAAEHDHKRLLMWAWVPP